jgi:hypothetical protein
MQLNKSLQDLRREVAKLEAVLREKRREDGEMRAAG